MWRVLVSRRAVRRAKGLGISERFKGLIEDLEEGLREDAERVLNNLLREPIVGVVRGRKVRRLRMGKYRVFFYIDFEEKAVVLFWIEHRERAYRSF